MQINYKLENAPICEQGICFKNTFMIVNNMNEQIILETLFLTQIYHFKVTSEGIYPIKIQ